MAITVFHMRRQDQMDDLAARNTLEGILRDRARRPSLDSTVEELEALRSHKSARDAYFRKLLAQQMVSAICLFKMGVYLAVANVEVAALEDAYRLTNNLDGPWVRSADSRVSVTGKNLGCDATGPTCASSDVGDLFRDDQSGEYFLCAGEGFVSLGILEQAR